MDSTELQDGDLVALIAAGGADGRAAEIALCRRFAPRIRLYGLRHLRDAVRADDLVQAALLGVLEAARAGRIEDRANTHRFVLGVCRNTALRMRQNDARTVTEPDDVIERIAGEAAAGAERVDLGRLMSCFDHLDERAKGVVMLSVLEERPAAEIAERLATTTGNVRVVRHRAVAALRRCMGGEGAPAQ